MEPIIEGDKGIADWLSARGYRVTAARVRELRRRRRHPIPSNPKLNRVLIRERTLERWLADETAIVP